MKRNLSIFLLAIFVMLFMSCSKTPKETIDGGYSFGETYFLVDGELVDAHESTLDVPAVEGYKDIEVISCGLESIKKLGGDSNISLEKHFSVPASQSELFREGTFKQNTLYKQIVRVVYSTNSSSKKRSATFRIFSGGGNGHAADIAFEQDSK